MSPGAPGCLGLLGDLANPEGRADLRASLGGPASPGGLWVQNFRLNPVARLGQLGLGGRLALAGLAIPVDPHKMT